MTRMLDLAARAATRLPALTLLVLAAITVGLGSLAGALEVDTGVDGFAPDDGIAGTLEDIEDRFETSATVQVLVDDGPGGDVIDRSTLADAVELVERLGDDPDIAPVLVEETIGQPPIVSFAYPFEQAADASGSTLADLDDAMFEPLATAVLDDGGEQVSGLFSDDLEADPAAARSGLVVVEMDATASPEARADAARAVERIVDDVRVGDARRSVLSTTAIEEGIEASLERDVPILLSVSLLLVVLVLALLFRSVVDVVVGLVGLVASIVWMVGFAALIGPGMLGWTGPFNQVSIAVPVLLVGLGIDYSVHLTTRYREQRRRGDAPVTSARVAMRTVGIALVLATAASVAGFLANVVTPLPPIRDFGIFAAIGIVAAFVVLAGAVPAARTLVDRRADRRTAAAREQEGDTHGDQLSLGQEAGVQLAPTSSWAGVLTTLATRRPGVALAATAVLLALGAFAATGLSTEFDERDFLPDGEPVLATLDRLDAQYGGEVGEQTFVLVEGDPDDPGLLAAVADVEDALADVDGVRRTDGRAQVTSFLELRDRFVDSGEGIRERLADDLETWEDPQGAAADIDLPEPLDLETMADDLEGSVDLPQDLSDALEGRLPADRSAVLALATTSDPDDLEDDIREQLAEDLAADRPDGLGDDELTDLAARPADQLTLDVLDEEGFPLGSLDDDDRDQLERIDALEAAGDVTSSDGEVLRAHLEVLGELAPDELDGVADADGLLLAIGTTAGQEGAEQLAADLADVIAPLEDAGGSVTVASEPLVNAEIIDELSAAQLVAIAISLSAAAVLLVTATWFSSRSVALGAIGIVPSVVALVLVLGTMRLIGLPYNALTATVASIAVGIGVPYGIHLTNRFREGMANGLRADEAAGDALHNTGPALVGSALTTGLAFAVLMLSTSTPLRQFGIVSTLMIVLALLGCLFVQPSLLVLWARRREARGASSAPLELPDADRPVDAVANL